MCRGVAEGGRRCPGCGSRASRDAHNSRRRHNRAVRRAVARWAVAGGYPDEVVRALAGGPPTEARRWAVQHGIDPDLLRHDLSATATAARAARAEPSMRWWTAELADQISVALGRQGHRPDEQQLLDSPVLGRVGAGEGTNETVLVELGQIRAYAKPFVGIDDDTARAYGHEHREQPLHEVAAWRLAAFLGPPWDRLVPTCVLREVDGELASLSAERHGYPSGVKVTGRIVAAFTPDPDQLVAAAVFDCLIGQQDRHPGNFLVDENGRLTLIDHGFAFSRPGDLYNWSVFQSGRAGTPLLHEALDALSRLLGDDTTGGLDGILQPERVAAVRDRAARMVAAGEIIPGDLDPYGQGDSRSSDRS